MCRTLSLAATLIGRLGNWLLQASEEDRKRAGLDIPKPPSDVHFVPGALDIFYDFRNSDIALHELIAAGAQIGGKLLDFGCSSGRNLAVLRRAFGDRLELFGADPAAPSVRWLKENVAGVDAIISNPTPPLPWARRHFRPDHRQEHLDAFFAESGSGLACRDETNIATPADI